jgi:hypothetical protein
MAVNTSYPPKGMRTSEHLLTRAIVLAARRGQRGPQRPPLVEKTADRVYAIDVGPW